METEDEWKFINEEIQKRAAPNEWHIGLRKQRNKWVWVSGEPMIIDDKWQTDEPAAKRNHAVMSKDYPPGSQGLFRGQRGGIETAYICEFKKGKKVTFYKLKVTSYKLITFISLLFFSFHHISRLKARSIAVLFFMYYNRLVANKWLFLSFLR